MKISTAIAMVLLMASAASAQDAGEPSRGLKVARVN
jgi:hypothetical protein